MFNFVLKTKNRMALGIKIYLEQLGEHKFFNWIIKLLKKLFPLSEMKIKTIILKHYLRMNNHLYYILHCNNFQNLVEKLDLKHVCNDQLVHLDKNICSCTSARILSVMPY